MFCPICGEKLKDPNQRFCKYCGSEIKITSEAPKQQITPRDTEIPVRPLKPVEIGRPGTYSKRCLSNAIISLVVIIPGLMLSFITVIVAAAPEVFYKPQGKIIRWSMITVIHLCGLMFGMFSVVNCGKAGKSEPVNTVNTVGSVFGIIGSVLNAILMVLASIILLNNIAS